MSYNWAVDIGAANSPTFRVGILVDNYYTRYNSVDDALVTVPKQPSAELEQEGRTLQKAEAVLVQPPDCLESKTDCRTICP